MAAHKHAEIIKAWADGSIVQGKNGDGHWVDILNAPLWLENYEYRIKPAEPERVYPVTQMTGGELYRAGQIQTDALADNYDVRIANAALRHAIDAGQVVTREELSKHDEVIVALKLQADASKLTRGARDMAVAKAVRHRCYTVSQQAIGKLDLAAIIAEVKS